MRADRVLAPAVVVIALVLAWRAIVAGMSASSPVPGPVDARSDDAGAWRAQLARAPADFVALVMLGRALESSGDAANAKAAIGEAVRLAPADRQTLVEAAAFDLRAGDVARGIALMRRAVDLYPETREQAWPVLVAALDRRGLDGFFSTAAREDPQWWPEFAAHACAGARDVATLQPMLAARAQAGTATDAERRCVLDRLQRENRWPSAYQTWLDTMPGAAGRRVGFVYNGDFMLPLSNLGFDWRVPVEERVRVEARPDGGGRALVIEFVDTRWTAPPIYQYLMLVPGRYDFEGRGRPDALDTWLGVQWALYCAPAGATPARQLARTGRFLGTTAWEAWHVALTVPADCPVQVLRLELANPRSDVAAPGDVTVRLKGSVWFAGLRVRSLD